MHIENAKVSKQCAFHVYSEKRAQKARKVDRKRATMGDPPLSRPQVVARTALEETKQADNHGGTKRRRRKKGAKRNAEAVKEEKMGEGCGKVGKKLVFSCVCRKRATDDERQGKAGEHAYNLAAVVQVKRLQAKENGDEGRRDEREGGGGKKRPRKCTRPLI